MDQSYAVSWGSLALINGNIAQVKGRNGWAWLAGSLLIGPIATFILLFIDPAPKNGARAA